MKLLYLIILFGLVGIINKTHASTTLNSRNYFKLLDYDDPTKLEDIVKMDKKIIKISRQIIGILQKRNAMDVENPKLGMVLVYAGMFITNTNNGVHYGKIDGDKLVGVHPHYGQDKLLARQKFATILLQTGKQIAPKDNRIVAWLSSSKYREEMMIYGAPTDATMKWIIDLVKIDPIFNLFNGLVLNNSFPFPTKYLEEMVKQANIMTGIGSPCIPFNPVNWIGLERCNTTQKTPYAYHGVIILMGDVFIKIAQRYLDDNDPSNDELAYTYLSKAKSIYNRPNQKTKDPTQKQWKLKHIFSERISLAKEMHDSYDSQKITDYFKTESGATIYQCNSCHQNGGGEEIFRAYHQLRAKK